MKSRLRQPRTPTPITPEHPAKTNADAPIPDSLTPPGRFAYEGLERAIHEKARLGIMTSLSSHPRGLLFSDLKEHCNLTDGNLSRHLQVLNDEGLVEIWKGYRLRRPQTLVRLTPSGRDRFLHYLATLEQVIADALAAAERGNLNLGPTTADGLSPA